MSNAMTRGVYAITDCVNLPFDAVLQKCRIILDCGAAAIQYRDKETSAETRRERASALLQLCRASRVPLIINDDPELAVSIAADGVHLGADDPPCRAARARLGPRARIGVSCYASLDAARSAVAEGADYVAFGAFFPTATKVPRARPGVEILRQAKTELPAHIVAIGGITPDNAGALVAAGVDLVAVVGALFSAPDPAVVMRKFTRLFAEAV
ncbi:MAG TPA: thiamine phosphate synthase [Gammaproteobacteria bacterium]